MTKIIFSYAGLPGVKNIAKRFRGYFFDSHSIINYSITAASLWIMAKLVA